MNVFRRFSWSYQPTSTTEESQEFIDHDVVIFVAVIVLLSMVLTMGRGATSHANSRCPETLQQAELVYIGASNHNHGSQTGMVWKDCGGSGDGARAKGCVFDVILVAWLQPECFDSELHEAYLSDHDYPFWLDRSLQTPTTLEEVRLGKHATVYSSAEFYLAHCAYFLEQSVRGFKRGGMVIMLHWIMNTWSIVPGV
ncbi:hypothetical protein EAF04_006279 [Stromatinia cepivora]|nr:hypothetical protein EAF04_006279 [Stromatinia cepivora]